MTEAVPAEPGLPGARLDRREVVKALVADRRDLLVVSGLGSPTWDLMAAGDDPRNFYLWGGMGNAVMIGLGLALARPDLPVLVITGDGDLLMGLGSLATVGVQQPARLSVAVLDNERYGETGMQPSHTAFGVDLAAVALASKFKKTLQISDSGTLVTLVKLLHQGEGPLFANVKVAVEDKTRVLPPRDGAYLKNRFREAVVGVP